ncbi:MAG: type II toxin-antitoxin system VapC family toxin [Calothrix sp. SM1_7_51]|nr:type II toxin-antitoxin system VapC family toxin [Calothrix sp. SM1_7_51]
MLGKNKVNLWILDTDCLSLLQRGNPNVMQRFRTINPQQVAITIITAEEQLRGRLEFIRRASSANELTLAYIKLRDTLKDLRSLNLLDFTQDACKFYEDLRQQKIRIGTRDLRIAATALSVDGVMVTRNNKDFSQVPNLKIEDWTIN